MADLPRRRPWLTAVAVGVAVSLALGGGFALARRFESPAQREASAEPPSAQPIFAVISRGALEVSISAQGTSGSERQLALVPLDPVSRAVVTRQLVSPGDEVAPFQAVAEINGRPLLALSGAFAYYRPLAEGLSGPDVRQLQANLRSAGLSVASGEAGTFGPTTASAVSRAYARQGYALPSGPLTVPLTEIAYAVTLPATVVNASPVGAIVDSDHPVVRAGLGRQVVRAQLANADVVQLRRGQKAELTVASKRYPAEILSFGTATGEQDQGQTETLFIPDAPIGGAAPGASTIVDIPLTVAATDALLVPDRAVAYDRDRHASVLIEVSGGLRRVKVKVLGSLAGQTALADAPGLAVGVRVRVG